MNFAASLSSELLKTKRTASFWMSIIGAAFIPALFALAYTFNADKIAIKLKVMPWGQHFGQGWQSLSSFLLPMYIILVCALIPQIEFKNNAWKQVFSSPQSTGQIFFSKFLTVHLLILFCYTLFNVFMILFALLVNLINSKYTFLDSSINWSQLMQLNAKTYISILGISAIQFWLSLRFKNFIAPVGIGLVLLIGSIIATGFGWDHVYKIPYAHPILTLMSMKGKGPLVLENHELNSIGYFVFFTLLGFLDLRFRKEKG
ncbi:MAG: hypothetical protein JWP69_1986 [Flaviaesturariibacter sp.]|nr:hypothetical protein [Flaviaesturariibacter sp.]